MLWRRTGGRYMGLFSALIGNLSTQQFEFDCELNVVARVALALWFLFLGSAIGSFLNVVIYRVPAGLNIAWPGSHCPKCKHAIRWYDNLPVLGWMILRGKCRDCHTAISIRYPIVEALTACVFLLLAWCELLRYHSAGLVFGTADDRGRYVTRFVICLLHCGLTASLLAATGIALDGKRTTWKIVMPIVAIATLAGLVVWAMFASLAEVAVFYGK